MSLIHLSCESKTWADVYTVRALCIGGTSFPWHGTLKMFAGVMPFSRTGRCIGIYPVYDDCIHSIGSWNESEASIVTLLCQGCWLSLPSPSLAGLHRHCLGKSGCIAASVILPPPARWSYLWLQWQCFFMRFSGMCLGLFMQELLPKYGNNNGGLIWVQLRLFIPTCTACQMSHSRQGLNKLDNCESVFGECWLLYFLEGLDLYCLDFGVRWVLQVGCWRASETPHSSTFWERTMQAFGSREQFKSDNIAAQ